MKNKLKNKLKILSLGTMVAITAVTLNGGSGVILTSTNAATDPAIVKQNDFYDHFNITDYSTRFQLYEDSADGNTRYYIDASSNSTYKRTAVAPNESLNGQNWMFWAESTKTNGQFSYGENNKGFSLESLTSNQIASSVANENKTIFGSNLKSYNGNYMNYAFSTEIETGVYKTQAMNWTSKQGAVSSKSGTGSTAVYSESASAIRLVANTDGTFEMFQYATMVGESVSDAYYWISPNDSWYDGSTNRVTWVKDGQQVVSGTEGAVSVKRLRTDYINSPAPTTEIATLKVDFGTGKIAYPDTVSTTTPVVSVNADGDLVVSITSATPITAGQNPLTLTNGIATITSATNWTPAAGVSSFADTTYTNKIPKAELEGLITLGSYQVNVNGYTVNNADIAANGVAKVTGDVSGFGTNSSSSGLSAGAITGIVIGSIAAVGLGAWFVSSRRSKK